MKNPETKNSLQKDIQLAQKFLTNIKKMMQKEDFDEALNQFSGFRHNLSLIRDQLEFIRVVQLIKQGKHQEAAEEIKGYY